MIIFRPNMMNIKDSIQQMKHFDTFSDLDRYISTITGYPTSKIAHHFYGKIGSSDKIKMWTVFIDKSINEMFQYIPIGFATYIPRKWNITIDINEIEELYTNTLSKLYKNEMDDVKDDSNHVWVIGDDNNPIEISEGDFQYTYYNVLLNSGIRLRKFQTKEDCQEVCDALNAVECMK